MSCTFQVAMELDSNVLSLDFPLMLLATYTADKL